MALLCGGANLVCLQEMHATSAQEFSCWVEDYNARAAQHQKWCCESSPGSARSCGVAILYWPAFQVLNVRWDDSERLVVVEFSGNNFDFQVMCLYAPNAKDEGRQFFESLYRSIDPDIPIVMCEDFNATVDPYIGRYGCNPESPWANNWDSAHRKLMSTLRHWTHMRRLVCLSPEGQRVHLEKDKWFSGLSHRYDMVA